MAELIKQRQLEKEKGLDADGDDKPAAGLEIDGVTKAVELNAKIPEAPVVKFSDSYFKKEEINKNEKSNQPASSNLQATATSKPQEIEESKEPVTTATAPPVNPVYKKKWGAKK